MCFWASKEEETRLRDKRIFYKVVTGARTSVIKPNIGGHTYEVGKIVHGVTASGTKVRRRDKRRKGNRRMKAGIYVFQDYHSAVIETKRHNRNDLQIIQVECDMRDFLGAGQDGYPSRNVACFTQVKVLT